MRAEKIRVARTLMAGACSGEALVLEEPLGFWGGVEPRTGRIVDEHHPQCGECIGGRILVLPGTRGSTSASGALAETLRAGNGPAGIVLRDADVAVMVAVTVASVLYDIITPVFVLEPQSFAALRNGQRITLA